MEGFGFEIRLANYLSVSLFCCQLSYKQIRFRAYMITSMGFIGLNTHLKTPSEHFLRVDTVASVLVTPSGRYRLIKV